MRRLVRALEDEDAGDAGPDAAPPDGAAADAEYAFDGYDIEFSTKVMLTPAMPPTPASRPTATAQSRRR
jgi:hypothetical protein